MWIVLTIVFVFVILLLLAEEEYKPGSVTGVIREIFSEFKDHMREDARNRR